MSLATLEKTDGSSLATRHQAKELLGTLQHIVWSDPESGAIIAKLRGGDSIKGCAPIDEMKLGETYRFFGRWTHHAKYGNQFCFETFVIHTPVEREGVIKYLTNHCIGIGQMLAARLWTEYGPETVEILRTDPVRVAADGILPLKLAEDAATTLLREAGDENIKIDLFGLFNKRGFPASLIPACIEMWGAAAAAKIKADPFEMLMAELPGCGFKRCDRLYLDCGLPRDSLRRQMLCGWNYLRSDTSGHTWFRGEEVGNEICKQIVGDGLDPFGALKLGLGGQHNGEKAAKQFFGKIRDENNSLWIAEFRKDKNEFELAGRIKALAAHSPLQWPDPAAFGPPAELFPHQIEKIAEAFKGPVGILAGTPGTGKTFTAAAAIKAIVAQHGLNHVAVCAPTGKAAVRVTEAMHKYGVSLQATTIHRLLGVKKGSGGDGFQFKHGEGAELQHRFIVVDEVSMLDTNLAASLFRACAVGTHVLLVGDPYQLPPVGHGAPLRDLIAADIPCGELTEIRRNSGMIVEACADIKDGEPFETCDQFNLPEENLRHMQISEPSEIASTLFGVMKQLKKIYEDDTENKKPHPVSGVQVLVAMNKNGELARTVINKKMQDFLNPDGRGADGNAFRVSDKIICLKNGWIKTCAVRDERANPNDVESYVPIVDVAANLFGGSGRSGAKGEDEVFTANGEIGFVLAVSPSVTIAQFGNNTLKIPMRRQQGGDADDEGGGNSNGSDKGAGCDFDLAYAITGHKSQGSEWPVVIVLIDKGASMVCCREWVYTAISRAKERCLLIGDRAVIDRQCRKVTLKRRKTFLVERLTGAI